MLYFLYVEEEGCYNQNSYTNKTQKFTAIFLQQNYTLTSKSTCHFVISCIVKIQYVHHLCCIQLALIDHIFLKGALSIFDSAIL